MQILHTDICVEPLKHTHIRIAPRSVLTHDRQVYVLAGVIDTDYKETIKILLQNLGEHDVSISHGQRVSQFICEQATVFHVQETDTLAPNTIKEQDLYTTEKKSLSSNTRCTPDASPVFDNIHSGMTDHLLMLIDPRDRILLLLS